MPQTLFKIKQTALQIEFDMSNTLKCEFSCFICILRYVIFLDHVHHVIRNRHGANEQFCMLADNFVQVWHL